MAVPKKKEPKKVSKKLKKKPEKSLTRPFNIESPGEKMDNQFNSFMGEVLYRLTMLETYCYNLGNDLSIAITAMKTVKNLMMRKKLITEKQFEKEFDKLYKEMMAMVKETEKQAASKMDGMPYEEMVKLMNDPTMGHS